MRRQSPIKNRLKLYAGVHPRIKEKVTDLAIRYDCSGAFVTNTLLADKLNINLEEHYYDYPASTRKAKAKSKGNN